MNSRRVDLFMCLSAPTQLVEQCRTTRRQTIADLEAFSEPERFQLAHIELEGHLVLTGHLAEIAGSPRRMIMHEIEHATSPRRSVRSTVQPLQSKDQVL